MMDNESCQVRSMIVGANQLCLWVLSWVLLTALMAQASTPPWAAQPSPQGTVPWSWVDSVQLVSDQTWVVYAPQGLWKTDDAGRRWSRIVEQRPVPPQGLGIDCFYFLDPNIGLLILSGEAFRTVDGGKNWDDRGGTLAYRHLNPPQAWIEGCTLTDADHGWAVGGKYRGPRRLDRTPLLLSTGDGGKSWQEVALPAEASAATNALRNILYQDKKNGWVVGNGVVLRTGDGGATWSMAYKGGQDYSSLDFATSQLGWVFGRLAIPFLLTKDGGEHWTSHHSPLGSGTWPLHLVCFTEEHCIASVRSYYSTEDGGQHWERLPTPLAEADASVLYTGLTPSGLVVMLILSNQSGQVLAATTHDEGKTWKSLNGIEYQPSSPEPPAGIPISTDRLLGCATHKVWPEYPALARTAKIEGTVEVRIQVNLKGEVGNVQVLRGHPLLVAAAVKAAKEWTFDPAECGGNGQAVVGTLVFKFPSE